MCLEKEKPWFGEFANFYSVFPTWLSPGYQRFNNWLAKFLKTLQLALMSWYEPLQHTTGARPSWRAASVNSLSGIDTAELPTHRHGAYISLLWFWMKKYLRLLLFDSFLAAILNLPEVLSEIGREFSEKYPYSACHMSSHFFHHVFREPFDFYFFLPSSTLYPSCWKTQYVSHELFKRFTAMQGLEVEKNHWSLASFSLDARKGSSNFSV